MVPEVSTGDTKKMMCLNCARKTVSPRNEAKYDRLKSYLKFRSAFTDTVRLTLAQIDGVIGDNLPITAYRSESWWENSPSKPHSKAWIEAGWITEEVNLKEGYIIFQKVKNTPTKIHRKKPEMSQKPFNPAPCKIKKKHKPSKTKIAKLYARIKNIERQKATPQRLRGSFQPKPT
jgi:hypothetical protein